MESGKGWQKACDPGSPAGRLSTGSSAKPGEALPGSRLEINTCKTALSRFDHTTGEFTKRGLSRGLRDWRDIGGILVQRDMYLAFLASCCSDAEHGVPADLAFELITPLPMRSS